MRKSAQVILSLFFAAAFVTAPLPAAENTIPAVSITAEAASKLAAPQNVKASATSTTITLSWDGVSGADGYRVYKYDSTSKKFVKYQNVSGTSCKVTDLSKNTKYYFKIATLTKNGKSLSEHGITGQLSASTKANDYPPAPSANYTGFASSGNKKYYYENGKFITGFKKVDSDYYYFTESGMLTGWLKYYGLYYYFGTDGKMMKSKTLTFSTGKYELGADGVWVWNSSVKEPTAKYTVKGDDLDISITMSPDPEKDSLVILMLVINKGDKDLTIYPIASSSDNDYSEFDRTLILLNESFEFDGKSQVIKPNSSAFVTFVCYSLDDHALSPTWYDKKTSVSFYAEYDKTTYFIYTSNHLGTYTTETHMDIKTKFSSLFDQLENVAL